MTTLSEKQDGALAPWAFHREKIRKERANLGEKRILLFPFILQIARHGQYITEEQESVHYRIVLATLSD